MNENTTAAQARELARELRELQDVNAADVAQGNGYRVVYHNTNYLTRDKAAHIAATLDALASECERLREENAKLSKTSAAFEEQVSMLEDELMQAEMEMDDLRGDEHGKAK